MEPPKGFMTVEKALSANAKSTIVLTDPSIKDNEYGIKLSFFSKMEFQVSDISSSDLIVLRSVRVQMNSNNISLITTKSPMSEIHILKSASIPRDASFRKPLQWKSTSPSSKSSYLLPSSNEISYAVWAFSKAEEMYLPTDQEFQEKTVQAMNVKDKFTLLSDVSAGETNQYAKYYDLVGQVIKIFETSHGFVELQFSDYTPNSHFYDHTYEENTSNDENHDSYGYGNKSSDEAEDRSWKGPFGKFTITITAFAENASQARSMEAGQWCLLKNVRICTGDAGTLEGKIHSDRGRVLIQALDTNTEPSLVDPRLKEALRRKKDHWKTFNKRQTQKSQHVQTTKQNTSTSKKIRQEAEQKATVGLNENVRCSYPDEPIIGIREILQPEKIMVQSSGKTLWAPFTNRKYRANVRVVDYFPHRIEDFAIARRVTEYEALSDHSSGEDSDDNNTRGQGNHGRFASKVVWEWRFALQVEDAQAKNGEDRVWLLVNNSQAQGLLGLDDDASNLRLNPQLVQNLRNQLFHLWGDLEERIAAGLPREDDDIPPSTDESFLSATSQTRRAGDQPDADDSDNELDTTTNTPLSAQSGAATGQTSTDPVTAHISTNEGKSDVAPRNKPFTCCIQQYGIQLSEKDPSKANAGNGKRWQRIFGIHGTTIPA
ncbi:Nucleic acid-binding protein [Glarea lozoyensis ATCC 20868]|uniref:Nucleic acid-binding protein n=1 Tax=Glarea lozoyensis (strain ATCC 20868 / MF5171) TaxID=1116229 RepID=S3DNG4_GLAL2|nr:Nucleic acid-binding protein [Glarea lozoyensis ATCC 20868]EPE33636.1 Nucleic acid-binding protein [Glarea lozoyensis ATCC 20868]